MRKNWSEIDKCEVCEKFDRGGANAYVERTTCLRCGTATTEKKENTPVEDPGTGQPFLPTDCPHRNTNHKGSSSLTRRTYCTDCNSYVHEELLGLPRSDEKNSSARRAPSRDVRPNPSLNKAQLPELATTLPPLIKLYARKMQKEEVMTQRQIEQIMSVAVDIIIDKPEPEIDVTTDKLPMVDLDTDERVFAILDEGCNSTCHTRVLGRKGTVAPRDVGRDFRITPRAEAQLHGAWRSHVEWQARHTMGHQARQVGPSQRRDQVERAR